MAVSGSFSIYLLDLPETLPYLMSIHNGHILLGISFQNYSKRRFLHYVVLKKKNQTKFLYTPKSVSSFEDTCALLGHILKAVEDMDKS